MPGEGIEAQTELALRNLDAILTAAGTSLPPDIARCSGCRCVAADIAQAGFEPALTAPEGVAVYRTGLALCAKTGAVGRVSGAGTRAGAGRRRGVGVYPAGSREDSELDRGQSFWDASGP